MNNKVKVALVGICGYGDFYLKEAFKYLNKNILLSGIIDPYAKNSIHYQKLKELGIPVFDTLEDFYLSETADLVVISAPIHLHAPISMKALKNGANVLCEKPVCATYQEALKLIKAEEKCPGFLAVGYQWSFSDAIQKLKRDILKGIFGKPLLLKAFISWPRAFSYYNRNNWAGKIRSLNRWILDSPVNNATAHYLHNMFYILGKDIFSSAKPLKVTAELYRANDIENFDTAFIHCLTECKTDILFYTSHAVPSVIGPCGEFKFEHAHIYYDRTQISAKLKNGKIINYGSPNDNKLKKFKDCVEAVKNGRKAVCGVKAASSQTLCLNGAHESMPEIVSFPEEFIELSVDAKGDKTTWIRSLQEVLFRCFNQNALPSELGNVPWSREGLEVNLNEYRQFPSIYYPHSLHELATV